MMGSEKPLAHRLRVAAELRMRTDRVGQPRQSEIRLAEQRLDLGGGYAPVGWLLLSATLPLLRREVDYVNLARDRSAGVGDLEVRAKVYLYQDGPVWRPRGWLGSVRHVAALQLGVKAPSGPLRSGEDGRLLAAELQPGTGSWDAIVGLAYTYFHYPWSIYASATGYLPTVGNERLVIGRSLRSTLVGQYQLSPAWSGRAGMDARWVAVSGPASAREPDSGGFIGFAALDVLWSPAVDLVVYGGARLAVLNRLYGRHHEGPIFALGVAYDL
jgi:hypothetical protein